MALKDYPIGATVWQQLEAKSADGLADFYGAVLGWSLEPTEGGGLFLRDGVLVGGLAIDPNLADEQVGWRTYLGAEDLEAAVTRAVTAGATVRTAAKSIGIAARAVELTDPFGAWFGLAEPEGGVAVLPSPKLGHLALVDPTNHDLDAQLAFQQALFPGQLVSEREEAGVNVFRDENGLALRASNEVEPEARGFMPPHWLPWFVVADQKLATEVAAEHGGKVNTVDNVMPIGRWGVVVDPAGGEFKTLQLTREKI